MKISSKTHPNHFYDASDQLWRAKCAVVWFNVNPCDSEDVLYSGVCICSPPPCSKDPHFGKKLFLPLKEGPCRAQHYLPSFPLSPPWATDQRGLWWVGLSSRVCKTLQEKLNISAELIQCWALSWYTIKPPQNQLLNLPLLQAQGKPSTLRLFFLFQGCSKIKINPVKGNQNSFSRQKF